MKFAVSSERSALIHMTQSEGCVVASELFLRGGRKGSNQALENPSPQTEFSCFSLVLIFPQGNNFRKKRI